MHRPNPSMPKSKRSEQHPEASETSISFFSDYQKYTLKSFPQEFRLILDLSIPPRFSRDDEFSEKTFMQ
ncbi:hypothetical protein SAMN04488511_10150 [Pedobacter suwonensis]|uniref:Uncharacterized protein n=1 Tax=Pedobacter suwonensis TaxID=332999 RepID=A0A1I0SEB0_9SPHI|nr:hypothetical protein SAMN04488511_10150 [Pedobacter suwonensis]